MGKLETRRERPEKINKDSLFRELAGSKYKHRVERDKKKYDRNQCRQIDWLSGWEYEDTTKITEGDNLWRDTWTIIKLLYTNLVTLDGGI